MRENCLICQKPLTNASRGRKRAYCCLACRRKRERILARLRRNVGRLEARKERYSEPGNSYGATQLPYLLPRLEQATGQLNAELLRTGDAFFPTLKSGNRTFPHAQIIFPF